jgi:tRNA modification GTPase
MLHETSDTIAAISTPPGEGGIGIVRLSGPEAHAIALAMFRSSTGRDPRGGHQRVFHGHAVDAAGVVVDEVLLHLMHAPHTYTREDIAEINGHGGTAVLNALLEECLCRGARLARPGEFTLRAFLNGRIDLVQAEAVIDQIQGRTRAALQAANAAASGTLSRRLFEIKDELVFALSRLEAAVDFPEDDLPELVDPVWHARVQAALAGMRALLDTADAGRILREGAAVVIAGRPNAGKSSLFNALLRDNRAIVSAQPGTTRDRIEEYVQVGGVPVKLIDTAGLREAQDEVERMGVDLARGAFKAASAALYVLDAAAGKADDDAAHVRELAALEIPVVLVMNKADLAPNAARPAWVEDCHAVHAVSALTGQGMDALEDALAALLLGGCTVDAAQPLLNRLHQKDSLRRAMECVERLLADTALSPEFLALELQEALAALGEITGETTPDDLLGQIFDNFCIGK